MKDIKVYDPAHPKHHHQLVLRNFDKPFNCDGCRELGFGPRYRCESNDCDACGKDIHGFSYHCEKENLDLHPCCPELKNKMVINDVKFELNEKVTSKCIRCKRKTLKGTKVRGWSYTTECSQDLFHVYCIREMMQESWKTEDYKDESLLSLKISDLRLGRRSNAGSSRSGKYWKVVKVFMTAVVAILLGDPTAFAATTLVNLIT